MLSDCCLHTCVQNTFAFQLQSSSGWHIPLFAKLSALLAQETTKSHHYLDYIMGPPTHAACPRYSDWDVYTSLALELVHCGTVWVVTKEECRCIDAERKHAMFTVCVSQQHWWSNLLLAVMLAEGGERAGSQCFFYLQDSNTSAVAHTGAAAKWPGSYLIQVSISARCGQHFGICSEYLKCQLVHKKLCNSAEH